MKRMNTRGGAGWLKKTPQAHYVKGESQVSSFTTLDSECHAKANLWV